MKKIAVVLYLLTLVTSCNSKVKSEKLLLGKWHLISFTLKGKKQTITNNACTSKNYTQFMSNGKAVSLRYDNKSGKCKLVNEFLYDYTINKDEMTITSNGNSSTYKYYIKQDTLFTKNNYVTQTYKKIKS